MDYIHLYRLTKQDLRDIIAKALPHLKGSLYMCTKQDLIGIIRKENIL